MAPHKLQQVVLAKVECAQGEQGYSDQGRPLQLPCTHMLSDEASIKDNHVWTRLQSTQHLFGSMWTCQQKM